MSRRHGTADTLGGPDEKFGGENDATVLHGRGYTARRRRGNREEEPNDTHTHKHTTKTQPHANVRDVLLPVRARDGYAAADEVCARARRLVSPNG